MEEVPHCTSRGTPRVHLFMLILIGLEAKGLLDFQGQRGITSVVRWSLRPVIFGVDTGTYMLRRLIPIKRDDKNYLFTTSSRQKESFFSTLFS